MINGFSIDTEDYWMNYLYNCLGRTISPSTAVVESTETLLRLLEAHKTRATFFVVGEVARQYPSLVRTIVEAGHEIASHGQNHYEVTRISREQFKVEISESKKILEDITGVAVIGHRATSFTVTPRTRWALEELAAAGYEYDSSVFPFKGRRYGWPGFCENICRVNLDDTASIIELPMTVVDFMGQKLPACGGGYLRHFPYAYTNWAARKTVQKRPFIVYIHPYDIDTSPPPSQDIKDAVEKAAFKAKLRHCSQTVNRSTVLKKLEKVLSQFTFVPLSQLISTHGVHHQFDMRTEIADAGSAAVSPKE